MARILLHSLVFAPDGVSTAYLMTDLARQLRRLGHQVTVLTTTPHYNTTPESLARQPMAPMWSGLLARSECDGMPVFHVRMPAKGQKVAGRLLDYLRFHAVSLAASVRTVGPYDIVIAPSPPLTIGVVAWLQGLMRRVPAVYNVQEIYPDFILNQGLVRNPWLIAAMRALERFVYARSARVVPISDWFSRTIQARGVPPAKLVTIPNFVDTELYRPLPRDNPFARQHGLVERFTVLYGGNIGLSQDWESFLHAANALARLPIDFVLVGGGAREEWLRGEVARRRLHNVKLLGYQPRELMPQINAASDLGTIPMKATTTSDTFPSKVYTIMACAKPVVVSADEDSELAWLVNTAGCGRVVHPDDPDAYTEAILSLFQSKETLHAVGCQGRQFVIDTYSKEAVGARYDRLVRELVP
ncbi:MAG TPA: glycosyltransferase family 4 protein [Gemmatimonadaceae bacterium]|nr:glycosyltransferase family 4 protein [Gemmatimonadaceae bacterium]